MKSQMLKTAAASAVFVLISAPAFADVTVMPGGAITAQGQTSLTDPDIGTIACTTTLTGTVDQDGGITITGASFAPGDPQCAGLTVSNLPWSGQFDNSSQLTLSGVAISPTSCGPASITAGYQNPNMVNFQGSSIGPCNVTGSLTVTPDQTVTDN